MHNNDNGYFQNYIVNNSLFVIKFLEIGKSELMVRFDEEVGQKPKTFRRQETGACDFFQKYAN